MKLKKQTKKFIRRGLVFFRVRIEEFLVLNSCERPSISFSKIRLGLSKVS